MISSAGFCISNLYIFLNSKMIKIAVKIIAIPSAIGAAHKTPSMPIPIGKQIVNGTKAITSRIKDRRVDLTGEEID